MSPPSARPHAFLDSNVLVEGLFAPWSASRAILILARARLFRILLSPYVEVEAELKHVIPISDVRLQRNDPGTETPNRGRPRPPSLWRMTTVATSHSQYLQKLTRASQELARAGSLPEVRRLMNQAAALAYLAKAEGLARESIDLAVEHQIRCQRKAGEMIAAGRSAGDLARQGQGRKPNRKGDTPSPLPATLEEVGVSRAHSARWPRIAAIPEERFEAIISEAKESGRGLSAAGVRRAAAEAEREERRQADRRLAALVSRRRLLEGERAATAMVDPGWDPKEFGLSERSAGVRPDYATQTLDEIRALPVPAVLLPDSHLYLWVTNATYEAGHEIVRGWGYEPKVLITWVKTNKIAGAHFMLQTEFMIFATRGSLAHLSYDVPNVFCAPHPGSHSGKPDEAYALVEASSPGPRLDMPARREREGWLTWGNLKKDAGGK